uniref:Uncharacterized protein n=1 Tax=Anopheles darlingi TaxID=43151 RepID=A0A2M4D500_ANODA
MILMLGAFAFFSSALPPAFWIFVLLRSIGVLCAILINFFTRFSLVFRTRLVHSVLPLISSHFFPLCLFGV